MAACIGEDPSAFLNQTPSGHVVPHMVRLGSARAIEKRLPGEDASAGVSPLRCQGSVGEVTKLSPKRSSGNQAARRSRKLRQSALCLGSIGAVALLAAACGSGGSASSSPTSTSSSSSPSVSAAVVKVVTVPTYGRILTTSSGKPLYTVSGSCTGSCVSAWPPLTVPPGTKPTGAAGVNGALGTVRQGDGSDQVTYNGLPLYTFVQDSSDHVTGQGVAGFSVVETSNSTTSGSSTSTTASSGY